MKNKTAEVIIVGAGLCGLALAKELSDSGRKVLVLERGNFIGKLGTIRRVRKFYDGWALARSRQGVLIYRVLGVGGTSVVSCGNAVEFPEEERRRLGLDLAEEFAWAKKECRASSQNTPIGKASSRIMVEAGKLGYDMRPVPKFGAMKRCVSCGNCILGCNYKVKWTALDFWRQVDRKRVSLVPNFKVGKVIAEAGRAVGVEGNYDGFVAKKFFADKVILCAGGIGTPVILQNSELEAGKNFFVDLFNVTYGVSKEFNQRKELTMSVVCDKFHKDERFILSPFVDNVVGLSASLPVGQLLRAFKLGRLMGIMTTITDEPAGRVHRDGRIDKEPTRVDLGKLRRGSNMAREILLKCGVKPKSIFVTRPRGAHPGGTAGIGSVVDSNLRTQMKGLYVCDASILPAAPGLPPMLSLIAVSRWFGRRIE